MKGGERGVQVLSKVVEGLPLFQGCCASAGIGAQLHGHPQTLAVSRFIAESHSRLRAKSTTRPAMPVNADSVSCPTTDLDPRLHTLKHHTL